MQGCRRIFAAALLKEGIYVTGFYFPVVPKGEARIRVQLSAAHTREHLDKAVKAFMKVGKELGKPNTEFGFGVTDLWINRKTTHRFSMHGYYCAKRNSSLTSIQCYPVLLKW